MGSTGFNGQVYVDIPPMPNTKLVAATFPIAAPAVQNRAMAMFVVDMMGMVSLTHNSTAASPGFTLQEWNDVAGYWIQSFASQACAQFARTTWKVFPNTLIYIFANTALVGVNAVVVVGGTTIQGNLPVITAGV